MENTAVAVRDAGVPAAPGEGSHVIGLIKDSLLGLAQGLGAADTASDSLGGLLKSSGEALASMVGDGGIIREDPKMAVATYQMLADIQLKRLDLQRKALDSAVRAQQAIDGSISVSMQLESHGSGSDVPEPPEPDVNDRTAVASSFADIVAPIDPL